MLSIILESLNSASEFRDFDVFYAAGKMFQDGSIEHAYNLENMAEAIKTYTGTTANAPWSYPPQFIFIVAGLSILPIQLAYFFFISISFFCYMLVLRYLSGPYLAGVLVSVAPSLAMTIMSGQNGFITGALIGLFIIAIQKRRFYAGLPLGLMIIKPHLAAGISIISFILRRWSVVATAGIVVLVSSLLVTFYFGQGIWVAFIDGARATSKYLELSFYPLNRMITVYAALRSFNLPAGLALTAQMIVALFSLFIVIFIWQQNWKLSRVLGISVLATLYMTPYALDYDLSILGIALSILMRDISNHATNKEMLSIFALSWLGCGFGLMSTAFYNMSVISSLPGDKPISLTGISFLILFFVIFNVIKRAQNCEDIQLSRG